MFNRINKLIVFQNSMRNNKKKIILIYNKFKMKYNNKYNHYNKKYNH